MKDEFVAYEDAGAAYQVALFSALMKMTQMPGFGLHKAEQFPVGSGRSQISLD